MWARGPRNRAQLAKLFPNRARRTNANNLIRFAARIRDEEGRRVLVAASWHQLRAAAGQFGDEAQIRAAPGLGVRTWSLS